MTEATPRGFSVRDAHYLQDGYGAHRLQWIDVTCLDCDEEFRAHRFAEPKIHLAVGFAHLRCPGCDQRSMVPMAAVKEAAGLDSN
jgi:ribosomal protein S27E